QANDPVQKNEKVFTPDGGSVVVIKNDDFAVLTPQPQIMLQTNLKNNPTSSPASGVIQTLTLVTQNTNKIINQIVQTVVQNVVNNSQPFNVTISVSLPK
ncbi:MAG: hypothetical protein K2X39_01850, partial [Silvanigrellaceae bacterium]|nr:hypothetical protein [Silvanigrellaceae bacterium]